MSDSAHVQTWGYTTRAIQEPASWGGYLVIPERIEFLSFNANRMHERLSFRREGGGWKREWLQP